MKYLIATLSLAALSSQCSPPTTAVRPTNTVPVHQTPRAVYQEAAKPQATRSLAPESKMEVVSTEKGQSSWYSVKTNGGTVTASGIPYANHKYTVAHKTLPFGTKVRVTNLRNNKSVIGTVTDRGPFIKGRIVDLSLVMAKQIDAYNSGVAPVKLEVLH